jgi:hypothetical protein
MPSPRPKSKPTHFLNPRHSIVELPEESSELLVPIEKHGVDELRDLGWRDEKDRMSSVAMQTPVEDATIYYMTDADINRALKLWVFWCTVLLVAALIF